MPRVAPPTAPRICDEIHVPMVPLARVSCSPTLIGPKRSPCTFATSGPVSRPRIAAGISSISTVTSAPPGIRMTSRITSSITVAATAFGTRLLTRPRKPLMVTT